jgi:hypothetical protein
VVVTPHVSVVVIGTRFGVNVEDETTTVTVTEGHVRVEAKGGLMVIGPGESIRSDDRRLQPGATSRATDAQAVAPGSCAELATLEARRACLVQRANGSGLLAENALYALALLERDEGHDIAAALERLREYNARFPRGALAPEVALAVTRALFAQGLGKQACANAKAFRERFPDDLTTYLALNQICRSPRAVDGHGDPR